MRYHRTINDINRGIQTSNGNLQRRLDEAMENSKKYILVRGGVIRDKRYPHGEYRIEGDYNENGLFIEAELWIN